MWLPPERNGGVLRLAVRYRHDGLIESSDLVQVERHARQHCDSDADNAVNKPRRTISNGVAPADSRVRAADDDRLREI